MSYKKKSNPDAKKPKDKKKSDYKTTEQRSVFLYGKPNKEKLAKLQTIQKDYNDAANEYISLIADKPDYLMVLLNRARKSPTLRTLEKENRKRELTSALSQSAFDYAVDRVATRLDDIKDYVYEHCPCTMSSSKALFVACIQHKSKVEMIAELQQIVNAIKEEDKLKAEQGITPRTDKTKFYEDAIAELTAMKESDFSASVANICFLYAEACLFFKVPVIKKAEVMLVSTLFSLEKANDIKAPYVINITDPSSKGNHIAVPLDTSKNSLRRLDQYGPKHSVAFTVRNNGTIKVTVAFEKKHAPADIQNYRGVDIGITDMLFTSDGASFGTFSKAFKFYDDEILPALGGLNSIRNKKQKLKRFLRKHPDLPDNVKKQIRDKMDKLEHMLRTEQSSVHKLNRFHDTVKQEAKVAVNEYIDSLKGDKTTATVVELLDIREFNRSKKCNRRYSMFARGYLSQKLTDTLNWRGYPYIQVEPAYTSQACPVCSYTHKQNRDGKNFKCLYCGHTDDADHVGSLNIVTRANDTEILELCDKKKGYALQRDIKALYAARHNEWLKKQPGSSELSA